LRDHYQLINDLEYKLKALESQAKNQHSLFEQSIVLCKTALEELKNRAITSAFQDPTEEIEFYKHIKPRVMSYLIFYVKRLHIDSKRSEVGKKEQIKYLKKFISRCQSYFNNNLEFYHYYKSNATHFDEQYFLTKNLNVRLNIEAYHFLTEDKFSTSHDSSVATIMAYTKLIEYLKNEINKLNNTTHHMKTTDLFQKEETKFNWTGTPTELVELSYALCESGRINNGNVIKKEFTMALQQFLNTEAGNCHNTFSEIRTRKKSPTIFLDTLTEILKKYIKDLDDLKRK
jgi:hypothetical protein